MKIYFAGEPKDVPTKAVVSRKVIRAVETPIGVLRALGQNTAFMDAMRRSPNASKIVTLTGGQNTQYAEQIRTMIRAEIPNITDGDLQAMVAQKIQSELLESFPEIWDALNNPSTDFPLDNNDAIDACIDIVKIIMDTTQLTEQEKALMAVDGFWDDQDLTEVVATVKRFREATKL